MLSSVGYKVRWVKGELPEPQADTLEEVVRSKLVSIPPSDGLAMVEDSGIFIKSLNGFPGVYSAYVLRTIGLDGILRLAEGKSRDAEFRAVVGLSTGRRMRLFEGRVSGKLAPEPRGRNGFGYDPIFIPEGLTKTSGELDAEAKNSISHRGAAMRRLVAYLRVGPQA